jgi:methionine sulfoxide reductase heme-binding subunit
VFFILLRVQNRLEKSNMALDIRRINETHLRILKGVFFLLALIPLERLVAWALMDSLGANPIEKVLRQTGYWTLTFLTLTMALTPIRQWTGVIWVGRFRRMLGLFAFFYSLLHLGTYVILDQFFDWMGILKDIAKRPYITVGFTALVLMIPLAVTSTDGMLRRLGGERWRKLHRLIYVITLGGIIHFWWLVKKDITEPFIFASIYAVSMLLRSLMQQRNLRKRRLA